MRVFVGGWVVWSARESGEGGGESDHRGRGWKVEREGRRRRVSGEEKSGERGRTKERKKQSGDRARGVGKGRGEFGVELSANEGTEAGGRG